ncbi:MAG: DNA polymerase ligase N-terminal domain-containing protein [Patescibacteria group bacterium]
MALRKNTKRLLFVVHKHHASHLHYDVRLEHRGFLKSWAVPKGPPRRPKERRLAVMVEDHPLAYARFHGTIPKGEYGAGKVEIWDKGTYVPLHSFAGGLRRGHLTFILRGKKLKGEYALVKFKKQKNQWLLIKAHAKK